MTTPRHLTLHTAGAQIVDVKPGFFTRFLSTLIDPNIVSLLFLAGLAGLGFELFHPGVVIPGAFGAICMVCALFGFSVLPLSWGGLMLVLLGAALLVIDAHVASHGALSLSGLVAMAIGLVTLFHDAPDAVPHERLAGRRGDGADRRLLGVRGRASRSRRGARRSPSGPSRSSACEGVVRDGGNVFVRGELWRARSGEPLRAGDRVAVDALDGLTLDVHRIDVMTAALVVLAIVVFFARAVRDQRDQGRCASTSAASCSASAGCCRRRRARASSS